MAWANATPGSGRVGEGQEADPGPPTADPRAERAERDGAPDAEAALPDLHGVERVAARAPVRAGRGDDVVQPTADDAEQHRPGSDVERLTGLSPARHQPAAGQPHGDHDADEDAQGVHPHRQRSEVEDPDGGARDVRGHLVAFWMAWVRSSGDAMVDSSTSVAVDLHGRGAPHAVGEALLLDRVDVVDVLVGVVALLPGRQGGAGDPGLLGEALELGVGVAVALGRRLVREDRCCGTPGTCRRPRRRTRRWPRGWSCRCAGCRRGSS